MRISKRQILCFMGCFEVKTAKMENFPCKKMGASHGKKGRFWGCVSVSSLSPETYDFSNPCVLDTGTTENLPEKAPEYASRTRNGEFSVFLKLRKLLAINPEE